MVVARVLPRRATCLEVLLEVFDLDHDFVSVASLLVREDLELVLAVALHEHVVLVEHFDRLVNLKDLPRLQVFEVYLPLLGVLV